MHRIGSYSSLPRLCARAGLALAVAVSGLAVGLPVAAAATTLTVSTSADISAGTGACGDASITTVPSPLSLREATCLADNIGGDVTISVPAGVYNLSSGELRLGAAPGQNISLTGSGQASTVIDAGGLNRVLELDFNLTGGISTSISGVTLRGGNDNTYGGGGIIAGSGTSGSPDTLTINSSTITGNQTNPTATNLPGGGVQFIGGSLNISGSVISNNSSGNSPGSGVYYQGLGFASNESLSISGSTVSGNTATASGAVNGGGLWLSGASYDISGTRFAGNTVTGSLARGAAIWSQDGALSVTGSTFTGNAAATGAGAAIAVDGGSAAVHYNRLIGNTAASGSAVSSGVGTAVNATENWWGCNTGPGSAGCDTVVGGPAVSPRLVLSASANPAAVTGPNGTSVITATLTHDSVGAAVDPAQLGAFDGLPVSWSDPQPSGATVSVSSSNLSSGSANTTYNSNAASGAGHVIATLDQGAATATLTIVDNQVPTVTTNPADQTVGSGAAVSFTASASGVPTPTVQWQRSIDGGVSFTDIAGATSTTYTFTAAAGDDGKQYRAVFGNVAGTATTTAATLTVGSAPSFTSTATTTFVVGQPGSFTITTTGTPSAALSRTGTFPAWLTLTDNGNGTGTLTGTPPAGSGGTYTFTLKAANGFSPSASQTFTLFVDESPTITSANHATFSVGTAGSFTVTTAAGFPTTTGLVETGSLPSGVSFTDHGDGTGTLAGTPAAGTGGNYPITITATAIGGPGPAASQSFTLTVLAPPVITSADHAAFFEGSAASFTVATTAGNPVASALIRTGALPSGVSFTDNGNGAATIAGTPAVGTGGTYPITITASNGIAPDATQTFTLSVNAPPTITSANHATFTAGTAASFTVTTSGAQPSSVTLTETGTLPPGMSFTDNGDGTATLAGTPTAGGSFPFTITASNGVLPKTTQSFTATVYASPVITSVNNATFAVDSAGSFTVTTTPGVPAATAITESGALPSGLTFVDNGNGTATLAGTPAAGAGGSYILTLTASNGVPPNSTQAFGLTVTDVPAITSADHVSFRAGSVGSFTVTTRAGFPTGTSISVAGVLPSGITFTDNGNGTATVAGTPATGAGGSYPVTLSASNSMGRADQTFTLTVSEPPAITSANAGTFTAGSAGSFTLTTVAGYPTGTTLTESGSLPSGVTFTDNGDGTATLAGTPAAASGGSYSITFTASNGVLPNPTQNFTLTVNEAPAITSANNAIFSTNTAGSFTVTTRAGFPAATTLTKSGTLPSGVTFTDNGNGTATLAGTPTVGSRYSLTLSAANSIGSTSQAFTLTVNAPPSITSVNNTSFTQSQAGTFTVRTSGYPKPALSETGTLPAGVTFTDNRIGTATLAGTPTNWGTFTFTITANNGIPPAASQSFTLTVNIAPVTVKAVPTQTGIAGTAANSLTMTASGGIAPYTWSATGLPPGKTINASTGVISGTPTTGGNYLSTVTAKDSTKVTGSVDVRWLIGTPGSVIVASPGNQTGYVGNSVNLTVTASGGFAPYTWSVTGLPSGLTWQADRWIQGNLWVAGTYHVRMTATDDTGVIGSASFTWTVTTGPFTVNNPGNQTGAVGTPKSLTLTASGGTGPYTWSATGVPAGLTLHTGNGLINGTPTTAGTYSVTVTATDANNATGSITFSWYISPMQILDPGVQQWEAGVPVNLQMQLQVDGSAPYTWSATLLPAGVTISATTGLISGTPAQSPLGINTNATVSVTDSTGAKASLTLTDQIADAVQVGIVPSPSLVVGQSYQRQITATYGSTPYTFTATNLPPGFSISAAGLISGAATTPGTYTVTVVVTDSLGGTDSSSGTWRIT